MSQPRTPAAPPLPERLAIARLSHQGNSFSPVLTGRAEFARPASWPLSFGRGGTSFRSTCPGPAALDLSKLPFRQVPSERLPRYGA